MKLRFPGVFLLHRPRASAVLSDGPTPWRSPRENRTSDQPTSAGTAVASPTPFPLRHIMYIASRTSQHKARGASRSSSAYGPQRAAARARFGVGCHTQMNSIRMIRRLECPHQYCLQGGTGPHAAAQPPLTASARPGTSGPVRPAAQAPGTFSRTGPLARWREGASAPTRPTPPGPSVAPLHVTFRAA